MRQAVCSIIIAVAVLTAGAAQYYVSPLGKDSDPGTSEKPFLTIQHAADVMKAGDECIIRQGIYREAVVLKTDGTKEAPIVLRGFPGEKAILSASVPLSGWEKVDGTIYKAKMDWDLGPGENQLYIDGIWKLEARYPNVDDYQNKCLTKYPNPDDWRKAHEEAGKYGYSWDWVEKYNKVPRIQEPVLSATYRKVKIKFGEGGSHRGNTPTPGVFNCRISHKDGPLGGKPKDYWKGTLVYFPGWWYGSGAPIGSSYDDADTLRFTILTNKLRWCGLGCFIGRREFIDKDYEWVLENGYIYMKMATGDDPNNMDICAKKHSLLVNLNKRKNIHLKELNFHGSGIQLDSAYDCLVDKCHFKYLSHLRAQQGNGANYNPDDNAAAKAGRRGIIIGGERNRFINNSIEYSAACGVIMRGKNNTVKNNYMRMICYFNSYASCVAGPQAGDLIHKNTFWIVGRSAINGAGGGVVTKNIFRDCMATSADGGVLYTWGLYPLNMDISYNWFDNIIGRPSEYLYCDAAAYAYTIHHNVFMPSVSSRFYALACQGGEFYNNTWACPQYMYGPFEEAYDAKFKSVQSWGLSINELIATNEKAIDTVKWKFADIENRDFRLTEGSAAIDAGIPIPGITDGYVGDAPDLGAYEYGGEAWVPGHDWGDMPKTADLWKAAKQMPGSTMRIALPGSYRLDPIVFNSAKNHLIFGRACIGGNVQILNMAGRIVLDAPVTSKVVQLRLPCGFYQYRFKDEVARLKGTFLVVK